MRICAANKEFDSSMCAYLTCQVAAKCKANYINFPACQFVEVNYLYYNDGFPDN